jgi:serine protease Do
MLGLQVEEIDRDNPQMSNLTDGVIVTRVSSGSPAVGKIQRGDLITHIQYGKNKYKIDSIKSFSETIDQLESGSKIAIFGKRSGSRFIVAIRLN